MFDYSRVRNYYIACGYTDMRKQIDDLLPWADELRELCRG